MKKKIKVFVAKFNLTLSKSGRRCVLLFFGLMLSVLINATPTPTTVFLACNDTSPIMTCASVLPNGDVALTWKTPVNTGSFNSYHIFKSNIAAGPLLNLIVFLLQIKLLIRT